MDRAIVYAGSIPLDTDILRAGRYTKAAFGNLASMLYGPNVMAASGLGYSASSSDLSLTVEAGSILAPGVMDASSLGGNGGGLRRIQRLSHASISARHRRPLRFRGAATPIPFMQSALSRMLIRPCCHFSMPAIRRRRRQESRMTVARCRCAGQV